MLICVIQLSDFRAVEGGSKLRLPPVVRLGPQFESSDGELRPVQWP